MFASAPTPADPGPPVRFRQQAAAVIYYHGDPIRVTVTRATTDQARAYAALQPDGRALLLGLDGVSMVVEAEADESGYHASLLPRLRGG